MGGLVPVEAGR